MNVGTLSVGGSSAVLDADAGWRSDDKSLEKLLNNNYPPESGGKYLSPHIPYGVPAGLQAADDLGGVWAVGTENEPLPDGAVS